MLFSKLYSTLHCFCLFQALKITNLSKTAVDWLMDPYHIKYENQSPLHPCWDILHISSINNLVLELISFRNNFPFQFFIARVKTSKLSLKLMCQFHAEDQLAAKMQWLLKMSMMLFKYNFHNFETNEGKNDEWWWWRHSNMNEFITGRIWHILNLNCRQLVLTV